MCRLGREHTGGVNEETQRNINQGGHSSIRGKIRRTNASQDHLGCLGRSEEDRENGIDRISSGTNETSFIRDHIVGAPPLRISSRYDLYRPTR